MKDFSEVKYFIDSETGCHIVKRQKCVWHESRGGDNGYVLLSISGKTVRAHRASYEYYKGPFNARLCVCHTCDNKECVNPVHLFLGTRKDNQSDMSNKGRHGKWGGEKQKLTRQQIIDIRASDESSYRLAPQYGVSSTQIRRIKNGARCSSIV